MNKGKLKYIYFLFKYGSIKLNLKEAKEVRGLADRIISLCISKKLKNEIDFNFYKMLNSKIKSKYVTSLILNVLIYDLGMFNGGHIRIIKQIISLKTPLKLSTVKIIFDSQRQ
ncbi:MAG: hypothetical protein QTO32_00900 [Candidatus Organicella extenuata]|jgi:ribosomal protein L17|uniref:50S ribosomal protein L17 n=1 Tax=Candidatus Organicella extenuata TaxID=2841811 RepID=A0AA51BKR5_9BACT|nr:MAG: hypothetical protein QTO32_00900 [Candidatus Organicella extenuata]